MIDVDKLVEANQEGRNLRAKNWKHMRTIDKNWARFSYILQVRMRERTGQSYHGYADAIDFLRRLRRLIPR